jgi:hypothetical protein
MKKKKQTIRSDTRTKKQSITQLKKLAQAEFNKYIRTRDSNADGTFICISCGELLEKDKCQAGHYWPVIGYKHLRFDERNVHAECNKCNGFNKSHLIGYTWNLIEKIGKEEYDKLHEEALLVKPDWKREELIAIREYYKKLNKNLTTS